MQEKKFLFISIIVLLIGLLGGNIIVHASIFDSIGNVFNNSSIPSRDQLPDVPTLPTAFPLPAEVANEQGARQLQSMNLNEAGNSDTVMNRINSISAENANPNRLPGALPSPISSLGSQIINTQSSSTNSSAFNAGNRPSASNPNALNSGQSSVTRNGQLPNNALGVSGGDPTTLANLLISSANRDVVNSRVDYLASVLALKLQLINTETGHLAGKMDEMNHTHKELNEELKKLAETMNTIVQKLPTIPKI